MLTKDQFKTCLKLFLVLTLTFGPIAAYRAAEVDPVQDAIYSEVHGLEEER